MKKKHLKRPAKIAIVILVLVVVLLGTIFGIRIFHETKLSKLHYEKAAINTILKLNKEKDVYQAGYHDTLNAAFKSKDYQERYFHQYTKIAYKKQDHLIKNINTLLDKKYTEKEISHIIQRGTDETVTAFAKRDKVDDIDDYMVFEYAKLENYDRYVAYQLKEREDEETTVTYVNLNLDKEFYEDPIVIHEYSELVLANKYRQLGKDYIPEHLVKIPEDDAVDEEQMVTKTVATAFQKLVTAAKKEGYQIVANSSYRSYEDQEKIYNEYKELYGLKYAEGYAARPGFSEHQTGLVIDVASKTSNIFGDSKEFQWMKEHAYEYGFIMRYPKGKENVTGYKYEAWHYRYVGKEIARYLQENDLTYDEYYVRFIEPKESK